MHALKPGWLRSSLARHILIVLLIKIVALTALWRVFVAPQKKAVAAPQMAERIAPPVSHHAKEVTRDD